MANCWAMPYDPIKQHLLAEHTHNDDWICSVFSRHHLDSTTLFTFTEVGVALVGTNTLGIGIYLTTTARVFESICKHHS